MYQKTLRQVFALVAGLGLAIDFASAQAPLSSNPAPSSGVTGSAASQLRGIYRGDIGQGYTGQSLNQIAINNARARVPFAGQSSTPTGAARSSSFSGGFGGGSRSKPFSSYSSAPTVSPYLNLFREDLDGSSDLNYNTLVRPMLQQQQFNEQMQRQSMDISRRLQSISAQADFNPQGSQSQYPTGHQTTVMNYSHYYPNPAARGRR